MQYQWGNSRLAKNMCVGFPLMTHSPPSFRCCCWLKRVSWYAITYRLIIIEHSFKFSNMSRGGNNRLLIHISLSLSIFSLFTQDTIIAILKNYSSMRVRVKLMNPLDLVSIIEKSLSEMRRAHWRHMIDMCEAVLAM